MWGNQLILKTDKKEKVSRIYPAFPVGTALPE